MEMVGSTDSINIVVQWKQANCARCGNPDWVGTRRYFVRKDSDPAHVTSSVVQEMGTGIDMGDWRELRNFVQWAQRNYPADRYALVVWDHGAGWRPTRAPTPRFRSVSLDDSTNSEIQTWQLPQALDVTPKMDLVVFDASLMQMLEVVYEMRNTTPLVVGSEESPPGEGYVYNTFLADLASNPAMSPADFGRQIVTRTLQDYGPNGNNTQSLIDTTRVADVAAKVDAFGSVLARHLLPDVPPSTTAMAYARQNAESYKPPYDEYKDLWHYAELMRQQALALDQAAGTATRTDIQNAASAVKASLDAAVLAEGHGALHPNSHGLAAYVPDPGGYLASYGNLALARTATSWTNWLQRTP
jgi:hypothetical protein